MSDGSHRDDIQRGSLAFLASDRPEGAVIARMAMGCNLTTGLPEDQSSCPSELAGMLASGATGDRGVDEQASLASAPTSSMTTCGSAKKAGKKIFFCSCQYAEPLSRSIRCGGCGWQFRMG